MTIKSSTDTLINRGLNLNIRSINSVISKLFQKYSIALNKIQGSSILGKTQMRQIQYSDGIPKEYSKGQIVFKNGIDKLKFLLDNKEELAKTINVAATDIYKNRRNLGLVNEYLHTMEGKYELGNPSEIMQMYISRHDENVEPLDSLMDWSDYILTQDWITRLAERTIGSQVSEETTLSSLEDTRIEYLTDMIQEMMADHEIDYHKSLENFVPENYMDKDILSPTTKAKNRLNSFGKLEYGFYEIFKPIGGSNEKYIKVKLSTSGELDISGVIGLADCTKVDWTYGSRAYLRSLNTGNQRYDFKLSIPFNDNNSIIWWKPDQPENIEDSDTGQEQFRYYKPYETERLLRWLGTTYIPLIDLDSITKKTVCAAPNPDIDRQRALDYLFEDATNILDKTTHITRTNESKSLLSMTPTATIDLINKDDGQYLRFVVSGESGAVKIAFNVRGKMIPLIQEMNHYGNTWTTLNETYILLQKQMVFLDLTRTINHNLEAVWNATYSDQEYIPENWTVLDEQLKDLLTPNAVDLIRFRNLDFSQIVCEVLTQAAVRLDFIKNISKVNDPEYDILNDTTTCLGQAINTKQKLVEIKNALQQQEFYSKDLERYVMEFDQLNDNEKGEILKNLNLTNDTKSALESVLADIYSIDYKITDKQFYGLTADELRKRIITLNNLIVRLPTDTKENRISSRNIFMDWKNFVDGAVNYLIKEEKLFVHYKTNADGEPLLEDGEPIKEMREGLGTDGKMHEYFELFIDPARSVPLIDYSYCIDENTNTVIHDRWDYWSVDDFA